MRLSLNTDYALRILIYLANDEARIHGLADVSAAFGMPHKTVMKITSDLVRAGFIESVRGRNGGIKLARAACDINLKAIVVDMEQSMTMAKCEDCILQPRCVLKQIFHTAVEAFLAVLERHSLSDLASRDLQAIPIFGQVSLGLDCDKPQ